MKKVNCFKCEHCGDIYEKEDEALSCEEFHAGNDDLEIVDCYHTAQGTHYGFPESIQIVIKDKSGWMAEYRKEREGSVEDFDSYRKAIDDLID